MWLKEGGGWAGARKSRWGKRRQGGLHPEPTREQLEWEVHVTTDTSAKEEGWWRMVYFMHQFGKVSATDSLAFLWRSLTDRKEQEIVEM